MEFHSSRCRFSHAVKKLRDFIQRFHLKTLKLIERCQSHMLAHLPITVIKARSINQDQNRCAALDNRVDLKQPGIHFW